MMPPLCLALCIALSPQSGIDARRADLAFLAAELPRAHKDLFFELSRDEWDKRVAALAKALPALDESAYKVALMRLVAAVGDGHTVFDYAGAGCRVYPVELVYLADGWFVESTVAATRAAARCRVVSLGGKPIAAYEKEVRELVAAENESYFRARAPWVFVLAELAESLGLAGADGKLCFGLEGPGGERFELEVAPVAFTKLRGLAWKPAAAKRPLWLARRGTSFWFERVEHGQTLYFEYNRCSDAKGFAATTKRLFADFDADPPRRLVVDLRLNGGGNSLQFAPFLSELHRRKRLFARACKLYVLTGRRTFSSAVLNATQLRRQTNALFLGEGTGGKPNHFGEVRDFRLPRSKWRVTFSTKHFVYLRGEDPGTLEPDREILADSKRWFAGEDPVLAAVLADPLPPAGAPAKKAPELSGTFETRAGGLRVLRVWGKPRERGYAQGYLLAADILAVLDDELTMRFSTRWFAFGLLRGTVEKSVVFPADLREEVAGILEGMRAKIGKRARLSKLNRSLDLKDLLVANALDAFLGAGCSGVTVWGEKTADGRLWCSRNFDWPYASKRELEKFILLVEEPAGKKRFAAVTWPGYVGVPSGMNEDGVAAFLHTANGEGRRPPKATLPITFAVRRILEEGGAEDAFTRAREILAGSNAVMSYNVRVVRPLGSGGEGASPSAVFELDPKGIGLRETRNPSVVTNHYLDRKTRSRKGLDSSGRAGKLGELCAAILASKSHRLAPADLWKGLAGVARKGPRFATLHSLVFRAKPWRLELAFPARDAAGALVAPPDAVLHVLTKKDLFGR